MVDVLPIRIVKSNVSSVGPSSDFIIRIGSTPISYAAHYVYFTFKLLPWERFLIVELQNLLLILSMCWLFTLSISVPVCMSNVFVKIVYVICWI